MPDCRLESDHAPDVSGGLHAGTAPGSVQQRLGETLDQRYQLLSVIGQGGMGSVFYARHTLVGRPLAIKVLDTRHLADGEGMTRLFREAQAAAAIGHPNIIDVLDVGMTPSGEPYLAMEYLVGEDLAQVLRREGRLTLGACCAIFEPMLLALKAAHAKQIVHRDLKPANIFLARREDGTANIKLIDFGIAKLIDSGNQPTLTTTGAMMGTPSYMSPEQASGTRTVDARADLYAVGVMLYQSLSGRLPFAGANYNALIQKIANGPDPELSCGDAIAEELCPTLKKALARRPDDRFQSADELLAALRGLDAWEAREEALSALLAQLQPRPAEPAAAPHATQVSPASPAQRPPVAGLSRARTELGNTKAITAGPNNLLASPSRRRRKTLVWAASGLCVALALVVWLALGNEEPAAPSTRLEPPLAAPASVQITISGAPQGAKLFYDGARVDSNPFTVARSETLMPLRVEMPGYEPFVASVVPSQAMLVRVALRSRGSISSDSDDAGTVNVRSASPSPPVRNEGVTTPQQQPAGRIGKSGRGTFYAEDFE